MTRCAIALLGLMSMSAAVTAAELSTTQRLELLERRVNRITEMTLQLDEMRRENRELRGEIERLGYEIEQLRRKQRDIYLDVDQRLGAASGAPAPAVAGPAGSVPGSSSPPAQAPASAAPAVVGERSTSPSPAVDRGDIEAEYQAAYDLLSPQQKRYPEAASAFAAFLKKYPNDELAPNAQYWLGEAYYVSQQNTEALAAFQAVVERYPDSTKAPGALFKIARLQQAAGQPDAARASYQRVLKDYPDSPAAGLARQRLDALAR